MPSQSISTPIASTDHRRRWTWRAGACLLGLVAFVVLAVLVLAHSLDQPWLKGRLQRLARTSAGIDLDYRAARIELLSGATIEGLVVLSPGDVRAFAPELIRVGRVSARWSLASLFSGHGPVLTEMALLDVSLTVIVDEHGRTSFDALAPPRSSPAPAPVPLSHQLAALLGSPLPIGRLRVDRVALGLVRTAQAEVVDRVQLRGVALALNVGSARSASAARLWGGLGSQKQPLDLQLSRGVPGREPQSARAQLWLALQATSSELKAALDLRMTAQTLATSVSADHWLRAEASLHFDPRAGRVDVSLDHAEAGDGAVTAQASVELADAGSAIVRRARGAIDLARLLQWLPAGLVPVTAERARARWEIDGLAAAPTVRLIENGIVTVDAELSHVAIGTPAGSIELGQGELSLRLQPAEVGAFAGRGSVKVVGARLGSPTHVLAADELAVDFDGRRAGDGMLAGRAGVRFTRIDVGGSAPIVADDGHVELNVAGLHYDAAAPLASRGDCALSTKLGSIDARSPELRVTAAGLTLKAHAALEGRAPYAAELDARAARLQATARDGKPIASTPARIDVSVRNVLPDILHPAASRGGVHAVLELGELQASIDATKDQHDAVDFALRASARSLKAARPFLPPASIDAAPWDQIAFALRSRGRVEHLSGPHPALRAETGLDLERPAFESTSARSLSLTLRSQGTDLQHRADLDLRAQGLAFHGGAPSDDHLALSASVDREHPQLHFELATEGRVAAKLVGSLSFDPSRKAVPYTIEGELAGLAPLAPFAAKVHGLDAFDLSKLEVGISARGTLLGVVASIARDGSIELEPRPVRSASVEGTTDLRVAHFRWARGDTAITTPAFTWHGDMHTAGERRSVESKLEIGTLHIGLGSRDVDLNGISDAATVALMGNLGAPEIELSQRLAVRAVEQTLLPEYPVGNLVFALLAERGPEGVVHVSKMNLANGLGGTALALTGNLDLGEGRRTLSVTTTIDQELARLSTIPERLKGRGKLTLEANVTSPDFALYRVRAALKGENVSLALAREGIELETANGEVPVTVTLEISKRGVRLERSQQRNPYSMLRFADQHPLLSRSGFLSIARLKTPFVSIAPLVGNLEIDQNSVALRQFEMGVRGGSVTGQCGLNWDGSKSTLEVHVRASGVRSSHGEPFDGNIAVAISAADRTIDGRAEILRIGARHLLDLLDLQDPLHADPAFNHIRTALGWGYPKNLRLVFDHGFASAHLELGGLAQFVSISELRGIPMGPIVDKMLAPLLNGPELKETL